VSDHRHPFVAERDQQVAKARRVGAEAVIAAAGLRGAVPGQVGGDHGVAAGQRLDHLAPVVGAAGHPVDEQQDRARAGLGVGNRAAVDQRGAAVDGAGGEARLLLLPGHGTRLTTIAQAVAPMAKRNAIPILSRR
jgi:hypothetical protein